ncbi:MAG: DUF1499 domain-containing protein [Pseudomonadota bacterium]
MEQTSKPPELVYWLGYIAIALLAVLPLAILTVRSGAWQQGLGLLALSSLAAALVLAMAVILLLLPRFVSWRKAIALRALYCIPGTLIVISMLQAGNHPRIHDITTNLQDQPQFTVAEKRRGAMSNSLQTTSETFLLQAEGYPELETLILRESMENVFDQSIRIATDLGWEVYLQDRNAGIIEAVDTTALLGFQDDIVIRMRALGSGTEVDLRSVSRVGVGDFGANAQRIKDFTQRLQAQ